MLYSDFTPVKRGRPVGSKNKSKLKVERLSTPVFAEWVDKGIGLWMDALDVPTHHEVKKVSGSRRGGRREGSGRPAGTPNKPGHSAGGRREGAGRPLGSKTKGKYHISPFSTNVSMAKKRGRQPGTKDLHTRKSKKSTAAATVIQTAWRSHTVQ